MTKQYLQDALGLLEDGRCWIKGKHWRYSVEGVEYCATGAIITALNRADAGELDKKEVLSKLEASVRQLFPHHERIVSFNDAADTSFADVEQVFQHAMQGS